MRKKIILVLLLMLFFPFIVNAEELKMEWLRSYGSSNDEYFSSIMVTKNNDYYVFVASDTYNYPDTYNDILIKYDSNGNILWEKNWKEKYSQTFRGGFVTNDEGIVIYGTLNNSNIENLESKGENDAFIIKYDKDGNIIWKQSWGGNGDDFFCGGILTKDNKIIMYGNSTSTNIKNLENKGQDDSVIVKFDIYGNLLWEKSWGGNKTDVFFNILETKDGEYVLLGESYSDNIYGLVNNGYEDAIFVKYDKDGNLIWQRIYGSDRFERIESFAVDDLGNIIMVGNFSGQTIGSINNHKRGYYDGFIIKIDKEGNTIWEKGFGGSRSDYLYNVVVTKDNDILISGQYDSTDILEFGGHDAGSAAVILKYDKNGNLIWHDSYKEKQYQKIIKMFYTNNNKLIVGIETYYFGEGEISHYGDEDAMYMMYDETGNLLQKILLSGNSSDGFFDILYSNDYNEIICVGYSASNNLEGIENLGYEDAIMVKYLIEYELENKIVENGRTSLEQQGRYGIIRPMPNEGYEVDKIIVKDKLGNVLDVEVTKLDDETYSFELYDDVSVEVLFKETLVNPKTGVSGYIGAMFTIFIIGICAFFMIRNCNNSYEL